MALGIGAGTSVFSAVDGVLLKPLPYAEPDRLLTLWQAKPALGIEREDVAPGNFLDWQARAGEVMQLAAADMSAVLVVAALAAVSAVLPTLRASRTNPARTLGNDG